jgi:hypothetical protein
MAFSFSRRSHMAYEKNRTLTVYEQSGNLYKNIPTIMLK